MSLIFRLNISTASTNIGYYQPIDAAISFGFKKQEEVHVYHLRETRSQLITPSTLSLRVSSLHRIIMSSHTISANHPLPSGVLQQIANASPLDEIPNVAGAVRHHIFWHGHRDKSTGKLASSMLFFVYQTMRHGPQNGFRLCLVYRGFHIASASKADGDLEDDIDRLEMPIPQGHMEVVILGDASTDQDIEDRD